MINNELYIQTLRQKCHPITEEKDLDVLVEKLADAEYVFLGCSSHGTDDFYRIRSYITRQLLLKKNFSFVAVEGDWSPAFDVNRYIKGISDFKNAKSALEKFDYWPAWLWANEEMKNFVKWLCKNNQNKNDKVGFYGLDGYNIGSSVQAIINFLEKKYPEALPMAYKIYYRFEPFGKDARSYAQTRSLANHACREEVLKLVYDLLKNVKTSQDNEEEEFNHRHYRQSLKEAEFFYRNIIKADESSWDIREHQLMETLDRVKNFYGKSSKAVIWAHNLHVGDARSTPFLKRGMVSLGQLARQKYGEGRVMIVGIGSYEGEVIATYSWGAPMMKMLMPQARKGSIEELFHDAKKGDSFLVSSEVSKIKEMSLRRNQRTIGIVYHPHHESSNYISTDLVNRYDAFIYIDETQALRPLGRSIKGHVIDSEENLLG